ncbi:hypothetical protein H0H92_012325 [Tricholoma furcatifolium]|nr:hypothetical protein H0H92_012325 [Tricholoma furcatifolium]
MTVMEVDLQSPSFMVLRSHTKRTRSPGSPGDRPNKRVSLAIEHIRHAHSSGNATPESPAAGSTRFPSEDWVHQTDGLTIDSPAIYGPESPGDHDEEMNMDADETISIHRPEQMIPQRPVLPPVETQTNFMTTSLFERQHQQNPLHLASGSVPTPPGPTVNVLSPTPPMSSSSTQYMDSPSMDAQAQSPSPLNNSRSGSAMVLSSPPSMVSRKQRFTMGPRADCIKCQMNVKGHSVHY